MERKDKQSLWKNPPVNIFREKHTSSVAKQHKFFFSTFLKHKERGKWSCRIVKALLRPASWIDTLSLLQALCPWSRTETQLTHTAWLGGCVKSARPGALWSTLTSAHTNIWKKDSCSKEIFGYGSLELDQSPKQAALWVFWTQRIWFNSEKLIMQTLYRSLFSWKIPSQHFWGRDLKQTWIIHPKVNDWKSFYNWRENGVLIIFTVAAK